jgi:hypothetical protein
VIFTTWQWKMTAGGLNVDRDNMHAPFPDRKC